MEISSQPAPLQGGGRILCKKYSMPSHISGPPRLVFHYPTVQTYESTMLPLRRDHIYTYRAHALGICSRTLLLQCLVFPFLITDPLSIHRGLWRRGQLTVAPLIVKLILRTPSCTETPFSFAPSETTMMIKDSLFPCDVDVQVCMY